MLVLARQRDESVLLGGKDTAFVKISPETEQIIERFKAWQAKGVSIEEEQEEIFSIVVAISTALASAERGPIDMSVVDIRGDKVRLGFNAPRSVSVHRKEIYDAICRENCAAA